MRGFMANVPNITPQRSEQPKQADAPATPVADLDEMAFRIFSQRAAMLGRKLTDADAVESYRLANAFVAVREKFHTGELTPKAPAGPRLADCCCPNQPRNHPHNLVAALYTDRKSGYQSKGDPERVKRIADWLDRNPTPESNPDELVHRLSREFPDLGWDLPQINTARQIFPFYAKQAVAA